MYPPPIHYSKKSESFKKIDIYIYKKKRMKRTLNPLILNKNLNLFPDCLDNRYSYANNPITRRICLSSKQSHRLRTFRVNVCEIFIQRNQKRNLKTEIRFLPFVLLNFHQKKKRKIRAPSTIEATIDTRKWPRGVHPRAIASSLAEWLVSRRKQGGRGGGRGEEGVEGQIASEPVLREA